MRIAPLHNIREPGFIPNGFQKEEASPPAPDPALQPEMRNRVEAKSDTRHAIEFLNPRTRLETNEPNRTNNTDPPRIEMGQERTQDQPAAGGVEDRPPEVNDAYQRLLRILLGQEHSAGPVSSQKTEDTAGADYARSMDEIGQKPLEMEGTGQTGAAGSQTGVYNTQAANLSALVNGRPIPVAEEEGDEQQVSNYYRRKGLEAYRSVQAFAPLNVSLEA